jgi:NADH-quinone oxidoreductase subunit C
MAYPMVDSDRLETVRLKAQFGDAILKVKEFRGETFLAVEREKIVEIIRFLKEDPELAFDYFVECVGVDYSRWEFDRDLQGAIRSRLQLVLDETFVAHIFEGRG